MTWINLLIGVAKLVAIFFSAWFERDTTRKEIKKTAAKEITNGLKERDPSKITAAYDKIRNL